MDYLIGRKTDEFQILNSTSPHKLEEKSAKRALKLFHLAAEHVPAYKKFLKKNDINHRKIKTITDYENVPWTDKENYVKQNSLNELAWNGDLSDANTIACSTGSTGEPMFWPRSNHQDLEVNWILELIFKNVINTEQKRTLAINTFALGLWSAGVFMLTSSLATAKKEKYKLTLVSPGINKVDIFKSINQLSDYYDQVMLIGYPPFVKDIIDEGHEQGIDWTKKRIKFFFGGEAITEEWRDYLLEKVGSKNPLLDTVNVYGTSEAGIPAFETPLSIAVRRVINNNEDLLENIFKSERKPALYQYNPLFKFIQAHDNEIIFTCNNVCPFVRYNIHDQGGVVPYNDMLSTVVNEEIEQLLTKFDCKQLNYSLPFVYLFGRTHNSVTLYGLNVYPENIKAALEDKRIHQLTSGKFKMSTEYEMDQNQYLLINIELARNSSITIQQKKEIISILNEKLIALNGEYRKLKDAIGDKALPKVRFLENGNSIFAPGIKNKYAEKK